MNQWNQELLEWNSRQWENAMNTTDNFCAEIRPKELVDQHAEKNLDAFKSCMGSSTERVAQAMKYIKTRGYLKPEMEVLDIGSGNGIFTLPFAEYYRKVTSLDISVAMQEEIRFQAEKRSLHNIDYINVDWKEIDLEAVGLKEKFDFVLCSINPRGVCSFETLDKMNHASKGGCCLMTFAGRGYSNHGANLQKLILGRTLSTTGGNDIIFPFNVVYHMGGEPDLNYTTVSWERRLLPEEAIEGICSGYWRFADITNEIKAKISDYVYANLEEGCYVERSESLIGVMIWDAWRIREKGGN